MEGFEKKANPRVVRNAMAGLVGFLKKDLNRATAIHFNHGGFRAHVSFVSVFISIKGETCQKSGVGGSGA